MLEYLQQFSEYLMLERGLAKNTQLAYSNDLHQFDHFLQENGGIVAPEHVTRDNILDFLEQERDNGQEIKTIARRLVSIRMFFFFLYREKIISHDITDAMDSPRMARIIPEMLSIKEVDSILKVYSGNKDALILRNRAILEILYATGIRASECVGLRMDGVDFKKRVIRVFGKGSKERLVPFGRDAEKALLKYITTGRRQLDMTGRAVALFLSKSGKPLTRVWIWKIVADAAKQAGVHKRIYPHLLRHSFASHLLSNGADLRVIQEMLGHADIGTTQVYTHTDTNSLIQAHRKFHPRS